MIQPMNLRPFGRLAATGKLDPSHDPQIDHQNSQMGKYKRTHSTLLGQAKGVRSNPQKSAILQHMAIHISAAKALRIALPVYIRPIEPPYFNDLENMTSLTSRPGGRN